jgi:hypothetical protein
MSLDEASQSPNAGMGASLRAGVEQLSGRQLFTFTLYKRLVLPADGFVFWAPAASVSPPITSQKLTLEMMGSLHLSQTTQQERDTSYARQDVIFTSEQQVIEFEALAADLLYVFELPNGSLAAFNGQRKRYDQAAIWHYTGRALLPFEASQFIASPADVPADNVVSNSLPFWLAMSTDALPVYPAFLIPQNSTPPFVSADIQKTDSIGASPLYGTDFSQSQLATEVVRFTFYGVRNNGVLDFQRALLQNSLDGTERYGVMNSPVPVDEKKPQSEFGIIAQEKTMDLEVNYYQARARDEARQLILSAFINITTE